MSPNALLDKQAVEIVKQLQKLQGLDDGDYDDSGSGPDRIGRRKTNHNPERAAQKNRQIGTLDVAFKKLVEKLNANGTNAGTPVLSRRLTMRRETMKALEVRVNSVMAERRKSHMQTLGAKNEYGNNNIMTRNQRNSIASSIPAKDVFENGHVNKAFEEDQYDNRNSLQMQPRNSVTWKSNNSRM